MKKQTAIKVISLFSAIILASVGFIIKEKRTSNYYLRMIENQYVSAYDQLNSSLNNISTAVEKAVYVSSAKKMCSLSTEIFSEAELAKTSLSKLPVGENDLSAVYKFLSQVGNYTLSVSKDIITENTVTERQRQELKALSDTAKTVAEIISDNGVEFNNPEQWATSIENRLNGIADEYGLAVSLSETQEDLSDYPTLTYDGPYSDHILEKTPLMVSGTNEYSQNEAYEVARKIFDQETDLNFEDAQHGKIECFRFFNDNLNIAVSKNGGYIVYMRKNRIVTDNLLTYNQAINKASKFLEQLQFYSMTDTYYYTDNGICVINFAYVDGQTVCYTDLIKVGVAMDTGEIMLLECAGYLTNHTERAFQPLDVKLEDAAEKISGNLEIEKSSVVLIPTDSGGEVRCYEFLCKGEDEQEILVYINARTLDEEQIFILLKSDGGTLVK